MEKNLGDGKNAVNALLGKIIQEINFKIGSGWTFEQLLDSIFESLEILIPYDRIGIALVEEEGQSIRLVWVRSRVAVASLRKDYSAKLAGSSLKKIIDTGSPRIINDLEKYQKEHPESNSTQRILKDGIRSSLTCPLRAQNKAVGVVFFSSCRKNTYDETHIEVFSSIADELSIVVEQARLKNYFTEIESREKQFSKVLHDLRSPLSVIQGYLDFAVSEDWYDSLPSRIKEICTILKKNAISMTVLLDEISNIKNFKEVASSLNYKSVHLHEFCMEAASAGKILAMSKDIKLQVSLAEGLPEVVLMDPHRIRRVLDNLFTNAVKFSLRRTHVGFSVWTDSDRLFFSVADQGQGIRKEDLSKLFRDFGTTSTLPSEGERSSGLGLSIAKSILVEHGGDIKAESQFGEGSTFTFWIPLKLP
ncbi:hypothetical protein AZI87_01640 [Bdellovibrio bacteriovorus]|uniref:histidine kinase n=1 Tax=Bdellovibrio bacteriovorus TaxID=959 RepID=A0A162GF66_BDEBC|nr:GAF domain-containing sensor histidine kinase [Bdellovibrio bacteriovorus]KYG68000.1 hypothetical protein AZI87_01640 [Bdellovibrio bacteriovorus]